VDVLMESPIEEIIVTDSIPLREEAKRCPKIKVLSISSLLAEAIHRIYNDESVSYLFV
jgi:ribose-phosphate pyrophosphokinase